MTPVDSARAGEHGGPVVDGLLHPPLDQPQLISGPISTPGSRGSPTASRSARSTNPF